jgi:hypothetical protein
MKQSTSFKISYVLDHHKKKLSAMKIKIRSISDLETQSNPG